MTLDIARLRAETPGCTNVAHLNNAGSSLPPSPVVDAVVEHLRREAEIGGYEAAAERHGQLEHTYDALAGLVGAGRHEIAVIENATRAWDMAFYGFPFAPGDRILTGRAEYASNWIALRQVANRTGASLEVVPDDEDGQFDVDALENLLDERVRLVSLVHVPTQSGLVNPAAAVGRVTRAARVPFLLDACQSVGQLPIDVATIGCDVLSATGRKFLRGPRGTGFLYVRGDLLECLEPPLLDMHAAEWQPDGSYVIRPDARRFENWERNVAAQLGLGAAVDYALRWGLADIAERVEVLADALRRKLADIPGVSVCDRGRRLCGIVTFTVEGRPARDLVAALRVQRINCHRSAPSSLPRAAQAPALPDRVRASVHYYNTEQEVARFAAAVAALA